YAFDPLGRRPPFRLVGRLADPARDADYVRRGRANDARTRARCHAWRHGVGERGAIAGWVDARAVVLEGLAPRGERGRPRRPTAARGSGAQWQSGLVAGWSLGA